MYVNDKTLDFPFCICWANESWTKGFFGSSKEVIMNQSETVESYRNFIKDAVKYLQDDRYITVQGKKLLIVYKPQSVPDCRNTLAYWREYCLQHGVGDIYILGCWTADVPNDLIEKDLMRQESFSRGQFYLIARRSIRSCRLSIKNSLERSIATKILWNIRYMLKISSEKGCIMQSCQCGIIHLVGMTEET